MSEHVEKDYQRHATVYTIGFLLSLVLTIIPYLLITRGTATGTAAIIALIAFAIAQLCVQLTCFLHLNNDARPYWNLMSAIFAATVVLILVIGSMWIMYHLNYNMNHTDVDQQIIKDEGYQPRGE